MKKFLFFLSFMLFFCINACAEQIHIGKDYQVNPHYEYLNIEYAQLYNITSGGVSYKDCANMDEAYRYFIEQAKLRNTEISVSFPVDVSISASNAEKEDAVIDSAWLILNAMSDYSEFDKNSAESDYLEFQWLGRNISYNYANDYSNKIVYALITFHINWFTDPYQAEAETAKVQEILDELNVYDKDEYTQVKAVYDWLLDNAEYVDMDKYNAAAETGDNVIYHSAYSSLIMGETVCQGYATAIYRLLRELGISCRVVSGDAGGAHAWNMVRIGSYYYLIDATWDDQPYNRTRYFLKAKYSDHTADEEFLSTAFQRFFPMAAEDYTETLYYTPNAPQNISITENGENITIKFDLDYSAQYAAVSANGEPLYLVANSIENDTTTHTVTHTPQNGTTAYEIIALRMEYNSRTDEETYHTNVEEELYLTFDGNDAHLTQNTEFGKIPDNITTITGVSNEVTVTLPSELILENDLTFDNVILSGACTIYANGHKLTITDTVTSDARLTVYGGGKNTDVNGDTYLDLNGGLYKNVYGGGYNGKVTGNTTVIFGGNANKGDVFTSLPCKVFGEGNNGAVEGTTSVTLKDNAVALYLVGAGTDTTALYIGPSAEINTSTTSFDKETFNTGVFSGSRTKSSHSDEINAVIYLDGCFETHKEYIGEKHPICFAFYSFENYIIKDGLNGTVEFTTDGKLKLIPDKKYYPLFNGAKAENVVSLSQKENTVSFDKLKLYFELLEEKANKIKLDIIADEPAFLFTGTYSEDKLINHTFEQAKTEEKEIELTENSQTKIFFWTNGLKPLAEPIVR